MNSQWLPRGAWLTENMPAFGKRSSVLKVPCDGARLHFKRTYLVLAIVPQSNHRYLSVPLVRLGKRKDETQKTIQGLNINKPKYHRADVTQNLKKPTCQVSSVGTSGEYGRVRGE